MSRACCSGDVTKSLCCSYWRLHHNAEHKLGIKKTGATSTTTPLSFSDHYLGIVRIVCPRAHSIFLPKLFGHVFWTHHFSDLFHASPFFPVVSVWTSQPTSTGLINRRLKHLINYEKHMAWKFQLITREIVCRLLGASPKLYFTPTLGCSNLISRSLFCFTHMQFLCIFSIP